MKLTEDDISKVLQNIPQDVRDFIQEKPVYLAGGFIRAVLNNEEIQDIDLFNESAGVANELACQLSHSLGSDDYETENAYTVHYGDLPIQFIHRWTFDNPYALISSFDFTIAQAAIWFENGEWQSIACSSFYDDIQDKRLVYTFPDREEEPGGSLLRVRKFLKRGYDISPENLAKVIARLVNGVDIDAFAESNEHERAEMISELLTPAYEGTNDDE